ncbi:MAG: stalk domain-containing protein [Chloroflexota bacterium]
MRRSLIGIAGLAVIALVVAVVCPTAVAAPAAAPAVSVTIDELPLAFDAPLQREEYRVLVPFRAISEAIGVTVDWVPEEKGIIATKAASVDSPATEVRLWIDRPTAMVNGVEQPLDVPPRLVDSKTFIPARFFATAFGCGVDWDEATQRVLITTGERTMDVYAFYAAGTSLTPSWPDLFGMPYPDVDRTTAHQRLVSSVGFGWFSVLASGRLSSNGIDGWRRPGGWENALVELRRAGLSDEMVVYASGSESKLAVLLNDAQSLAELRAAIVAEADNFGGVNLDWEGISSGLDADGQAAVRARYAEFVTALAADLKAIGKTLTVTVQPGNSAFAAGFDYATIGAVADRIVLMAYEYYDRALPSPLAPMAKVEEAVQLLLKHVSADRILLGVAPGGVAWQTAPTPGRADVWSLSDVAAYTERYVTTWDETADANWLSFTDAAGRTSKLWIEDGRSIGRKIALAKRYGLRGIALWRLGVIPRDVWQAVDDGTKPLRALPVDTLPPDLLP